MINFREKPPKLAKSQNFIHAKIYPRKVFKAYGIPQKIVKATAVTYDNTTARVVSLDGNTDYFEILS